jgi:hypothetical protein
MLQQLEQRQGYVLGLRLGSSIDKGDFDQFMGLFEPVRQCHGRVRLLLNLEDLDILVPNCQSVSIIQSPLASRIDPTHPKQQKIFFHGFIRQQHGSSFDAD